MKCAVYKLVHTTGENFWRPGGPERRARRPRPAARPGSNSSAPSGVLPRVHLTQCGFAFLLSLRGSCHDSHSRGMPCLTQPNCVNSGRFPVAAAGSLASHGTSARGDGGQAHPGSELCLVDTHAPRPALCLQRLRAAPSLRSNPIRLLHSPPSCLHRAPQGTHQPLPCSRRACTAASHIRLHRRAQRASALCDHLLPRQPARHSAPTTPCGSPLRARDVGGCVLAQRPAAQSLLAQRPCTFQHRKRN